MVIVLFIERFHKRVYLKHRHPKGVEVFSWNKWVGGVGECMVVFVWVFQLLCQKMGCENFLFVEGKAIYILYACILKDGLPRDVLIGILLLWME